MPRRGYCWGCPCPPIRRIGRERVVRVKIARKLWVPMMPAGSRVDDPGRGDVG